MRTPEKFTPDCRSDGHDRCMHLNTAALGFPRHLRDGLKVVLCGCECHGECPLVGGADVSDREWAVSCSCPGARLAQDIYRKRHEADQRLRVAEDAVQANSVGKTRAEIREILNDELTAGSGAPPSIGAIDATVDHIARSAEREAAGKTGAARTFGLLAGDLKKMLQIFRSGLRNEISDPSGRDPYYLSPDSPFRGLEVVLDTHAKRTLDELAADRQLRAVMGGVGPEGQAQRAAQPLFVPVRLESATEEYEIEGDQGGALLRPAVTVHVGRHRLGELSVKDGARLAGDLHAARQQNHALWMGGSYFAPTTATRARLLLYPGPLPFP